jgi:subtilase family serine protease
MMPLYNAGYTGSGINLAIIGEAVIAANDSSVAAYRTLNGLPAINLQVISIDGTSTPSSDLNDPTGEAYLDIEVSGAVAMNAAITYVYEQDSFVAAMYAMDNNLGTIISTSYGTCESAEETYAKSTFEPALETATAAGMTVIAADGDRGAAGCDLKTAPVAKEGLAVEYPASSQYVTALGGTEFNEGSGTYWNTQNNSDGTSVIKYIPEIGWNDFAICGVLDCISGGGESGVFPKPSWQSVNSGSYRGIPDIAFAASSDHDGYALCTPGYCTNGFGNSNTFSIGGGTSAAAPLFAGMLSVTEQMLGSSVGNINPDLYAIANSSYATVFHDITTGNNIVPCDGDTTGCSSITAGVNGTMGYTAGPGYDLVTGLGSLDGNAFATALQTQINFPSISSIGISPLAVDSSSSATLTITLSTAAPTGGANITLTSSNSSAFPVLAAYVVPAGQTSASFPILAGSVTSSATVTVTATYNSSSQQATLTVLPTPVTTPSLTIIGTSISVAPGATMGNVSSITVTPSNGFTGAVALSCAITPAATNDPATCSVPASVTISGTTPQTVLLTVTTTAATAMNQQLQIFWPSTGGSVLACILFFGIRARRRSWSSAPGILVILIACAGGIIACHHRSNSGTTAGTYTVTVTGRIGTYSVTSSPITLTVQ